MNTTLHSLTETEFDKTVEIVALSGDEATVSRMKEIGCLPGTSVQVIRKLAFGGPIILKLRDCKIAIRQSDAHLVKVQDHVVLS